MESVKYPELKKLLEQKFEEWRKSNNKEKLPNVRELAKEIQHRTRITITHSSLHDWQQGRAKPHPEKVKALARFFAQSDANEQENLATAIRTATRAPQALVDPLDVVESGSRGLRVGVIHFPRFCELDRNDEPLGFLDTLVKQFLSFTSLEWKERARFKEIPIKEAERLLCDTGDFDLVLGLFVDPSRTLNLWFYRELPILIPLNGVRARRMTDSSLLQKMTTPNNGPEVEEIVYPIIDPKELGGIYITNFLGINSPSNYHKVEYDLKTYAAELMTLSTSRTQKHLPVCVIDEVSCCLVQQMVREKAGRSTISHGGNVDLSEVSLLADPPDGSKSDPRFFPRYRYGLAIAKKHIRWRNYFEECFEIFLESNTDLVSGFYRDLYSRLSADLERDNDNRIRNWLSITKRADTDREIPRDRRISPTWEAILRLAKTLIDPKPAAVSAASAGKTRKDSRPK